MAWSWENFDPENEPEFGALEKGDYRVLSTKAVKKPTNAGDGVLIEVTFEVIQDVGKGQYLWDRFTIEHPNPKTVEIASRKLGLLCRKMGVLKPKDEQALVQKVCIASVVEDTYQGKPTNQITTYKSVNDGPVSPKASNVPATGEQPWKTK